LLAEAAHDLSLVPLLMLSIFVSHVFVKLCNNHGYDEILIFAKGVPFLDSELPLLLAQSTCTARDLCEIGGRGLVQPLPAMCPVELLQQALKHDFASHFPVIEEGVCLGMVTRNRIEAVMGSMNAPRACSTTSSGALSALRSAHSTRSISGNSKIPSQMPNAFLGLWASWFPRAEQAALDGAERAPSSSLNDEVALLGIMNPTPYTLLEDMPVSRLHPLFSRSGLQAACVVSRTGVCIGVLNRITLIKAVEDAMHGHAPFLDMSCDDQMGPDSKETVNNSEDSDAELSQMQELRNYIQDLEHKVDTLTLQNDNLKVYGEVENPTASIITKAR